MADLGVFSSIIVQLNHLGFYGFILPWLLVFALTFGLMKRSFVFGKDGDKVAAVVAMALAFFITAYTSIGDYFIMISGFGGMLLGALLVVVLFFALLGFQPDQLSGVFSGWHTIGLFALLALIVFFVFGGGYLSGINVDSETTAAVFLMVIIIIAVMFVTQDKKPAQQASAGH